MRKISELLQILLNYSEWFGQGLCATASDINEYGKISSEELREILEYIRNNRPSKYSSISAFFNKHSGFYWEYGDIKLRIKWCKKHIKLTSK